MAPWTSRHAPWLLIGKFSDLNLRLDATSTAQAIAEVAANGSFGDVFRCSNQKPFPCLARALVVNHYGSYHPAHSRRRCNLPAGRLEQIDENMACSLPQLDRADRQGEAVPEAKITRLSGKIAAAPIDAAPR
jgi:hypothetical protein